MDKFKDLEDLYPRPDGLEGQNDGKPSGDHLQEKLTDEHVTMAYMVPWLPYGNLKDATDEVTATVWGEMDGRRTIMQQAWIPDMTGPNSKNRGSK